MATTSEELARVALLAKASRQTLEGQQLARETFDFLYRQMLRGAELMGLTPIAEIPTGLPQQMYSIFNLFLPLLVGLHRDYYGIVHAQVHADGTVLNAEIPAPRITLAGPGYVELAVGAEWAEPGASAVDYTALPPLYPGQAVDVAVEGAVDTATPGEYVLTYTATDAGGRTATATRTVVVS